MKWFNTTKGFGFLTPAGTDLDAFLHVSVLQRANFGDIPNGTMVTCTLEQGPKGLLVSELLEVHDGRQPKAPVPRRPDPEEIEDQESFPGAVKWFNVEKGFGFITLDDGEGDVFVHKTVLRKCDVRDLEAEDRVIVKVHEVAKGREAIWVALD